MARAVALALCCAAAAAFVAPAPRLRVRTRASAWEKSCWSGDPYPTRAPPAPAPPPPPHTTTTYSECARFAAPALAIYVAGPLMSLIDAALVGRKGSSAALAALGPAGTISDSATTLLVFLSVATTNFVARSGCDDAGAGDLDAAARAATTGLALAACFGVAVGGLLVAKSLPLSLWYAGGSGDLAPLAARYVAVRAYALPAALVASVAQAACLGARDAVTPAVSVAVGAALNLAGDIALVPSRGLVGAAEATAASQYAAAALLVRKLWTRGFLCRACFEKRRRLPRLRDCAPFFGFGPFVWCCVVKLFLHNSAAKTAASMGGAAAAAHTVIFSVAMFCFVLGDVGTSLALAFLPRFAKNGGEAEGRLAFDVAAARPSVANILRVCWTISGVCVAASSAVVLRGARAFTTDGAVVNAVAACLPLTAGTLALHASAVTLEGVLLVRRDLGFLCGFYAFLAACVAALHGAVARRNLGLRALWGVYVYFQGVRALAFAWRAGLLTPRAFLAARRPARARPPTPALAAR